MHNIGVPGGLEGSYAAAFDLTLSRGKLADTAFNAHLIIVTILFFEEVL